MTSKTELLIKKVNISDLQLGSELANLGKVLEIEVLTDKYSLVIFRQNEKQVHKFDINQDMYILE